MIPLSALVVTLAMMLVEQQRSRRNEGLLRARGAVEPTGDVYRTMAWAYPGAFVLMTIEGMYPVVGDPAGARADAGWLAVAGIATFVAAKTLKYWAIASLGMHWTFRVLVIPDAPLVARGPYAALRHPNYIAVVGEMVGFALVLRAPLAGLLAIVGFGLLLRRRIVVEERALRT